MKSRKPEDNIEEQLSLELENLYKEIENPDKITRIDKIDVHSGVEPDLGPAYEIFKVEPDATHEELKEAYEELASAWNPKRFTDHPEWIEKAEKKLEIINKAYEMILSARIREIRKRRKTIQLGEIEKEADPAYTRDGDEESEYEEENTRRFGLKHALIFAGVPVFLLLCWFIISPLLENPPDKTTEKKSVSEKLPPLAGNVQQMPVPEAKPDFGQETKPGGIKPEGIKPEISPVIREEAKVEKVPQNAAPVQRVVEPPPKAPAKATEQKPAPALKPVADVRPQAVKAAPKPEAVRKGGAPVRMPFSIQIGAVKDRAKGAEYLGRVKKDGYKASLVETKLPSGEKGFRVLVGGFQTRDEAFAYMNDKGLKQKYPGSFVQKNTP